LTINGVDECHLPVRRLAVDCERKLQARVVVNLYAAWTAVEGFGVHWDDHEVLIIQVAGQKLWRLYGYTEKWPVDRESPGAKTPPSTSPIWESTLSQGDALYIPRGCWHTACAAEGPSLHLTLGWTCPTGLAFINWLQQSLKAVELFRRDIPLLSDGSVRAAWMQDIRRALEDTLSSESLFEDFAGFWNGEAEPRQSFILPWTEGRQVPLKPDTVISLAAPRPLQLIKAGDDDVFEVLVNRRHIRLVPSAASVLRFLSTECPVALQKLHEEFEGILSRVQLDEFIAGMLDNGVVQLTL